LACNAKRIAAAHEYLKRIDKTQFDIAAFTRPFEQIIARVIAS